MKAYILSCLGRNEDKRAFRKGIHRKQIEWLKSFDSITEVIIRSVNYESVDYIDDPFVSYSKASKYESIVESRNVLLNMFYSEDAAWGAFLDDDTILYPHCDGDAIFNIVEYIGMPSPVDMFWPIDPRMRPFNKDHETYKSVYSRFLAFKTHFAVNGGLFLLRNYVKDGNPPIFVDTAFDDMCEDHDFSLAIAYSGLGTYECQNIIIKDLSRDRSTLEEIQGLETFEQRKQKYLRGKQYLARKWGDKGVFYRNGVLDRRGFRKTLTVPNNVLVNKENGQIFITDRRWNIRAPSMF